MTFYQPTPQILFHLFSISFYQSYFLQGLMGHNQSHLNYSNVYGNSMYSSMGTPYGSYGNRSRSADNSNISCVIAPINGIGGLYLGDIRAAQDLQMLQRLGIRAVLTSAKQADLHYDHSIVPYHLVVNGKDTERFNIAQYFDQSVNFIKQCLASTNVLVHCMAGVSRSATLIIAYLMTEKGVNYESALNYVRQCRPIINPNGGFIGQLREYEIVLAQRKMYGGYGAEGMMMSTSRPFSTRNLNSGVTGMNKMDYSGGLRNQWRLSGVRERQNYF